MGRHRGGVGRRTEGFLHALGDRLGGSAELFQQHMVRRQVAAQPRPERQPPQAAPEDEAVEPGQGADQTVSVLRGKTVHGVLLFVCWLSPNTSRKGNALPHLVAALPRYEISLRDRVLTSL